MVRHKINAILISLPHTRQLSGNKQLNIFKLMKSAMQTHKSLFWFTIYFINHINHVGMKLIIVPCGGREATGGAPKLKYKFNKCWIIYGRCQRKFEKHFSPAILSFPPSWWGENAFCFERNFKMFPADSNCFFRERITNFKISDTNIFRLARNAFFHAGWCRERIKYRKAKSWKHFARPCLSDSFLIIVRVDFNMMNESFKV